jgi:dolichol-phosphate mannosyltransferase
MPKNLTGIFSKKELRNLSMKPLVIIPTYNEKENIESLIEKIAQLGFDMLFIDDNSPDGTGEIIEKLKNKFSSLQEKVKINIIHRKKKLGLGTAYTEGFRWALKEGYEYMFTMDADFSHPPEVLPELLRKLRSCDVVVGSRYIKGGEIKNWPVYRKIISFLGNIYARIVGGLPIHDCTSGFNGFRRVAIESIGFRNMTSEGYGFLIELKYRCFKKNFRICEYPIVFTERRFGKSKISKKIIIEAFFLVLKLRLFGI